MFPLSLPAALMLIVVLLSSAACSNGAGPSRRVAAPPAADEPERVPGQYIIRLAQGASLEAALAHFDALGVKFSRRIMKDYYLIEVERDPGIPAMLGIGEAAAEIDNVEPNLIAHTMSPQ